MRYAFGFVFLGFLPQSPVAATLAEVTEAARRMCLYSSETGSIHEANGTLSAEAKANFLRLFGEAGIEADGGISSRQWTGIEQVVRDDRIKDAEFYSQCIREIVPILLQTSSTTFSDLPIFAANGGIAPGKTSLDDFWASLPARADERVDRLSCFADPPRLTPSTVVCWGRRDIVNTGYFDHDLVRYVRYTSDEILSISLNYACDFDEVGRDECLERCTNVRNTIFRLYSQSFGDEFAEQERTSTLYRAGGYTVQRLWSAGEGTHCSEYVVINA